MTTIASIEDLRLLARRRAPRAFYDYAESGSYNEETLRANRADLEKIRLRQRVLVDVSQRSLATTIVGQKVSAPFALSPIGLARHAARRRRDPRRQCRERRRHSLHAVHHVDLLDRAGGGGDQAAVLVPALRHPRPRILQRPARARGKAAKCSALVLTVDLQVLGQRHRDIRNGMTVPPEFRFENVVDIARKPRWLWSIIKARSKTFGNLAGHVKGMDNVTSLAQWTNQQFDPALNWKDIEWIKKIWPGKLIIKGILDPEDARPRSRSAPTPSWCRTTAAASSTARSPRSRALPAIADAVGSDTEVLFDGGVRSGSDMMRALALGARACLIGRAYVWGLGAMGQAGVAKAIDILKNELSVTMALSGVNKLADIDRRVLVEAARGKRRSRRRGGRRNNQVVPAKAGATETITASPNPARRA